MAISSIYERQPPADFTGRLYRGAINADPRMAVDPYADPGNAMPHVTPEEANPARHNYGVERIGGGQNALTHPLLLDAYHAQQRNALLPAPQQLMPGNIDIHNRPVVTNADGSISTVRSMTITDENGRAILIPTIIQGRGAVSPEEAIRYYEQTGEHLGMFNNIDAADTYAQRLHEQQAVEYRR
jgi:hypothetical protein